MGNNKRYSFFKLFEKEKNGLGNYKLVIPIIQRDYAQGRDNEKARTVRKDFLTQLLEYMKAESGSHDLDFVYGVSEPSTDSSKKREFVPLDGQQRLTTLFLIHFYLATRVKHTDAGKKFFQTMRSKSGKLQESLFTYRTRMSAVEFCNCLMDDANDFSFLFELDEKGARKEKKSLSYHIRNSNWFYPDWLNDPTVNSMLTMLDAIDNKFDPEDHEKLLKRLISEEDPSVTFIFMDLDEYELTDDLYIKMNSRGKPLTAFENFKAKYEQYISDQEKGKVVNEGVEIDENKFFVYTDSLGNKRSVDMSIHNLQKEIKERKSKVIDSVKSNFSFNIDSAWSYLFWKYSKEEIMLEENAIKMMEAEGNEKKKTMDNLLSNTLDLKISNFIKMVLANQYAIDHTKDRPSIPEELIGEKQLSFSILEEIGALSTDGVVLMTRFFELFTNSGEDLKILLPQWISEKYYDEKSVFEALIKSDQKYTFIHRLMMYAYTMYRLNFGDNSPGQLAEWMHFLYNMTFDDNALQDLTRGTYHRAIGAVNELITLLGQVNDNSIITLLTSDKRPQKLDFFPDHQYKEEILKAYLFSKDKPIVFHANIAPELSSPLKESDTWSQLILKLEAHPYFTGQIGFILKMAGIEDFLHSNEYEDWDEETDTLFKNNVVRYGNIASKVFEGGYGSRQMAKKALLERAMLSKYPDSFNKKNFLNSTNKRAGSNNLIRDYSWKTFMRIASGHDKMQERLKDIFDSINTLDVETSLKSIVENPNEELPLWAKDIVRYPVLIGNSNNGFFDFYNGYTIVKGRINFSADDLEVFSFVLYKEYLEKNWKSQIGDSFSLNYEWRNISYDDVPHIKIEGKGFTLRVRACVDESTKSLICYYIESGNISDDVMREKLLKHNFVASENSAYLTRQEDELDDDSNIDVYRTTVVSNIISLLKSFETK